MRSGGDNSEKVLTAVETIGLALHKRRRDLYMSRERAGELAGISLTRVNIIERGLRNYPIEDFLAYCSALRMRIDLTGLTPSVAEFKRLRDLPDTKERMGKKHFSRK
jgi:transcriptional regulator with XRE-family HTH domain